VAQDRNRQLDHISHRLHLTVAADGDVDHHIAVAAQDVVEGEARVMDRPFARDEIGERHQRASRKQDDNATFHVDPRLSSTEGAGVQVQSNEVF
jgi:hypothetical protein